MTSTQTMSAEKSSGIAQHIALSDDEKEADALYNVDQNGWALIESYIWDIGDDEELERLIDKALRILLIHHEFEKFIWKNPETLKKLYYDETFPDVISQIHRIIMEITQEMVVLQIENTSAFANLKKNVNLNNLKGIFKHVAGKSSLNEMEIDTKITEKEEKELKLMTDEQLFGDANENEEDLTQKYAFWNIAVYNQLKKQFGINNKAKESYLWSFLVSIACCIRYLEIEINAMPQFDIKKSDRSHQEKQKVIWKGFVVPPTHGTIGVNYHPDDDTTAIRTANTEFIPIDVEKRKTVYHTKEKKSTHCAGCFVRMNETNWYKDGNPYCSQCIKFRVYQECVRKFVLEYDNEEIRDDLWPWYENNKNRGFKKEYKAILDMYTDQVLTVGTILESNLKYYVPRSQTLDAAKLGRKSNGFKNTMDNINDGERDEEQIRNLLIKSRTQFQPYRNIRYLRKFSAMFMMGEREIWKDLLKLKKYLKKNRYQIRSKSNKAMQQFNDSDGGLHGLNIDKSAIDDEGDFVITPDDRTNLEELLNDSEIHNLLYGKHGMDRINAIQQRILNRPKTMEDGTKTKLEMNNVLNDLQIKRVKSVEIDNMNACKPGIDKFLKIWSRLPHWWEPLHDRILLELALMHKLDVNEYYDELDDEEYYQEELEDHYYRAFEFWCTKEVNVQHRLRFLLFVIDQRCYPESMIFMNDIMRDSHLNSFKILENRNRKNKQQQEYGGDHQDYEDSSDDEKGGNIPQYTTKQISKLLDLDYDENNDEKPVRDIEREFRDIVQLLDPEALGVRIWRFIMNQMAAKQRKSLWKALTILAEELPSNMILSLLEEDRDLLRRGRPRYVNAVCQSVIKGSNYPVATALHLARYMDENASSDLARTKTWSDFCNQYEDIAIYLINEVESDHLLALLLEIPTDIQQKTIIEMAVLYKRIKFINSARIQGVMTHCWSECEFLNPNKTVRTTYYTGYEFWKLLWKSPVRFYFCPLGLYATTAFLYVGYLILVSYVTWEWVYPYSEYKFVSAETLMWISNAGYILYELLEFESKGAQYFAVDSLINVFDTIISINWIILFILRIFSGVFGPDGYVGDPGLDPTIDRSLDAVDGSALTRTDPSKRNESYTIFFMFLWSIQIIILWIRIVGLLQRTEIMGPLLRMMLYVAKDVASFMILVIAITTGFLFAIHYIVGGDIDRDVTCDILATDYGESDKCEEASQPINSVRGITIYLIQTLLGQQDWEVLDTNPLYGFDRGRAQLLTLIVLGYVILGTILSLNMLIAIMTTSFDVLNDKSKQQLAFLRVETTYDMAHRGRMMPPPCNIFVIAVWILITMINMLIKGVSCGKCKLNLDNLNPLYIDCLRRGNQHGKYSSIILKENDKSRTDYSASKEKKDLREKLERLNTKTIGNDNDNDDDDIELKQMEKNKSSTSLRFDQLSALFEQIDSLTDDTKKRYCKYCYCRMKDIRDGSVDEYFALFENNDESSNNSSFGLDRDDMRMIKRLFRYCSLCPQCFRPYGVWKKSLNENKINESAVIMAASSDEALGDLGTDRYDRHHVLMEVVSCYFFLLLVWIPLVIICFIPALFSKLTENISKSEQTGYASNKQLDAGAFGDYHRGVQQQIVKNIVDKQYQGTKAFDDELDSDDDDDDDNFNKINHDKLENMIYDLMGKVEEINDKQSHHHHGNTKKKTTMQLQRNQRQKIKQKEKEKEKEKERQKKQQEYKNNNDEKENQMIMSMSVTNLRESIRSEKIINIENDTKEEEEEEEEEQHNEYQKKVNFDDQRTKDEAP